MKNSLIDSVLVVCKALDEFSVEYVIVGGTAVALHGYYRHSTKDVTDLKQLSINKRKSRE